MATNKKENNATTFTYQICSDLHVEYIKQSELNPLDFIKPVADILILAGDIGSFYKIEQLKSFLSGIQPYFKFVLYVIGNHEYYTPPSFKPKSIDVLKRQMFILERELNEKNNNFKVLDQMSVQIGDTVIAGTTLWSDLKCSIPIYMARISGFSDILYNQWYKDDVQYIKNMIDYCEQKSLKLIIVTHYTPTYKCIPEGFNNDLKYHSLYASNLEDLMKSDVVTTWVCGHVHHNFDFMVNKCRVIGNQHGKPKDNITDYNLSLVLKSNA